MLHREARQQFAAVIRTIIESSLAQTPATSQKQIDGWLKGALDGAIGKAQDALVAVTRNFRGKLLGARSYLLWSVFRCWFVPCEKEIPLVAEDRRHPSCCHVDL